MSVSKDFKIKDKNKAWYFQVSAPTETNPKARKTVRGFRTKKDAQKAELEWLAENKNKTKDNSLKVFDDVIMLFLEHAKNYAKKTYRNYEGYYNNHLQVFHNVKLDEITYLMAQQWKDNKIKAQTSQHVISGCIKLLKASFNYAIELELIEKNPFKNLKKPTQIKVLRNRFSTQELKTILTWCKKEMPEYYLLFVFASLTGMRVGEYLAVCKEDISYENMPHIKVTKQYNNGEIKAPKTNSSIRIVELPKFVLEAIDFHVKKYEIFQGFLFKSQKFKDKPISYTTVRKLFRKLLVQCGYDIDYMRLHDLRGEYVDIMHANLIPTVYISRQVGHSTTKLTNDIYSQILQDTRNMARDAIDSALG